MTFLLERWWGRAVMGTLLLASLLVPIVLAVQHWGSATDERILMTFLINLVVVVGLQTFVGTSGVISFAHVGLMGVGAYTAALLTTAPIVKERLIPEAPGFLLDAEMGFLPATAVAIAFTMVIGLVVGIVIVRLSGAAAAVATLGLLVIIHTVLANAENLTRGALAFSPVPRHTTLGWALGFALVAILIGRFARESNIGLQLRSSRGGELPAQVAGVNVTRARLVMWVVSAGIAAAGGSLYAHWVLTLLPSSFFFALTFVIVTMVIVGGQSVSGAVIGAASLTLVTEFLRRVENSGFSLGPISMDQAPGLTTIVLGLMIVLTMIFRPQGLMGRWELDERALHLTRLLSRRRDRPVQTQGESVAESAQVGAKVGPRSSEEGAAVQQEEGRRGQEIQR